MTAACGLTSLHPSSHSFLPGDHDDDDDNNNDIQISMSNSSDASSDFFSPISCYAAAKRRTSNRTSTTPAQGNHHHNRSSSHHRTAEKLPPLHDSSWIGARLSPIGSFDQEAAIEDDDDDDDDDTDTDNDHYHQQEEDRLASLYHRALQESLDAAARKASLLRTANQNHNHRNNQGRWKRSSSAHDTVPNERTHLLATTVGHATTTTRKRGRVPPLPQHQQQQRLPPPPLLHFPLHPLWDRRRHGHHHHHSSSSVPYHYRLDDRSYSYDTDDDRDNHDNNYATNPNHHHPIPLLRRNDKDQYYYCCTCCDYDYCYQYARYACCPKNDECCGCCCYCYCCSTTTNRYLPSFGTVLCTISGLLLLAMLFYDAVTDFRHSYYYSRDNNNSNNNNYYYSNYNTTTTTIWNQLQQWLQWEQQQQQQQGDHSTWMTILTMRPRWTTFLLFGALIVDAPYQELNDTSTITTTTTTVAFSSPWLHALHCLLVRLFYSSQFQQPWRFLTSSVLTTNVVEYLLVVLAWRLIYLAATRVSWWYWCRWFAAAVTVGQWWTLLVGSAPEDYAQQTEATPPVFRLTGCLAWGTAGILCLVGTKCPSRRLVFFWLAILLVLVSFVAQFGRTMPYGSVWGAVASSLWGWAAAAASNAQQVAQHERDKWQRRQRRQDHYDHNPPSPPDMIRNGSAVVLPASHDAPSSSSPTLAWLDLVCWMHRLLVAAIVVTPLGWAFVTMLLHNQ